MNKLMICNRCNNPYEIKEKSDISINLVHTYIIESKNLIEIRQKNMINGIYLCPKCSASLWKWFGKPFKCFVDENNIKSITYGETYV